MYQVWIVTKLFVINLQIKNFTRIIIAAIILGGTSLYGGIGSVWGTLFAVLILGTINNGLTLMNVSSSWQEVAKGTVLILAVGLDQWRMRA